VNQSDKSVEQLWDLMNPCTLCPRECKVNRRDGQTGFCGIGDKPVVSSVGPHFGEESVLVGTGGSGTIFFAGCNLGCVFCQNFDISHHRYGHKVTIEQLAQSMLELQHYGCCNINFVTPTHVASMIVSALELARKDGLTLPTVYNTGGYDSVDTLKLLEGFVDIYMPDMNASPGRRPENRQRRSHSRPFGPAPCPAGEPCRQLRNHRLFSRPDKHENNHQRYGPIPPML
jgi:putative pyruvate formate lyase activating enzyme